jgi:hypothetical protein
VPAHPTGAVRHSLRNTGPPAPRRYFDHFLVPPDKAEAFASLFSIILSIEVVQSEFVNDHFDDPKLHDELLQRFIEQYTTICTALNLTNNTVRLFAETCHIPFNYCLAAVEKPRKNASLETATLLGRDFTTLSDCCIVGNVTCGYIFELIIQIRSRLVALGIDTKPDVKAYCDKWFDRFAAMKPQDDPPAELLAELASDQRIWFQMCNNALTDQ